MSVDPVTPIIQTVEPSKPFRKEGLGYVYEPVGKGVRISVDFLSRHRDEMSGEITVSSTLPGMAKHLHQARFNLSSTTSRGTLARALGNRTTGQHEIKWDELLESFCATVLRAERKSNPIVRVGRLDFGADPPDTIEKILPAGMATQLFAPGKTGKGWIAWGMAVAVQTGTSFAGFRAQQGNVLYLDWEDNPKIANQRVQMVARGMGLDEVPEIDVMSMHVPLRIVVNELARVIDEQGYTMLIIDSAQKAIGSTDFQSAETGAALMFEALRMLGDQLTVLLIDHTTKSDARNDDARSFAYGSVMKTNWVRNVWELKKDQEEGSRISQLGLYHANSNHSEKHKPIGLLLDFQTPGEVHIRQDSMMSSDKLSAPLSLADRCARALRFGPKTLKEVATSADATQDSCRITMGRDKARFIRVDDGRYELGNQLRIVEPETDFMPEDLPFD